MVPFSNPIWGKSTLPFTMANMLSEDKGVCIVDAMKALYSSEVYSKLEDESTKEFRSGGNMAV